MWILFSLMKKLTKISKSDILKVAAVGGIATLHWITFYGSIKYSNVSVALVCFSTIGFFTALFEPFILKKKMNWTELVLGLITLAGIYIIFHFDSQYKTGIIIGMVSAVFASLFPIYNHQFLKRIPVETMLTWQQTGGFILLSIFLPFYLQKFPGEFFPGWADFGWLLMLSWLCSVLAFQLSGNALKRLSAFTVNLSYNLEPVYGILLAFVIYNENEFLSKWFFLGFGLIAIALITHIILLIKLEKKLTDGPVNRVP